MLNLKRVSESARMAAFQGSYKWMTVFLLTLATIPVRWVSSCYSTSRDLHICLNIYLERDFPLIETIVVGLQSGKYGRGRVILEGPDLTNICNHISSLYDCYWGLLPECDTLSNYDHYMKVMDVLNATRNHLCYGGTNNIRDVLLNSGCLARARSHINNCKGFDWMMSWRHVLRMQVSPSDTCRGLQSYQDCLRSHLMGIDCGAQASEVYLKLIDVWLRHWCAKNLSPLEEKKYFYMVAIDTEEKAMKALQELERRKEQYRLSGFD